MAKGQVVVGHPQSRSFNHRARISALRGGTALALVLATYGTALADGGTGGNLGGTGGGDNFTPGGSGLNGNPGTVSGGGGGGGAGNIAGGVGGTGSGGAAAGTAGTGITAGGSGGTGTGTDGGGGGGGAGAGGIGAANGLVFSTFTHANGGSGGVATGSGGGGGGGAGAFDFVVTDNNAAFSVSGTRTAGAGGAGGASASGNGGNGGGGGVGFRVQGTNATMTVNAGASVIGGAGGAGGNGGATGGNGHFGGNGFTGFNAQIINNGTIAGGDGGARGTGATNGTHGGGGFGIFGSDLTITNNGTISGGLAGDAVSRQTAVYFSTGTNVINFGAATSGIIGGIEIGIFATAQFNAAAGGTGIANTIVGAGALIQNSANTLILTATNTFSGGTTIGAGTLQLGNGVANGTLGTGAVVNNSILAINATGVQTLNNTISGSGGVNIIGTGTTVLANNNNTYTGATNVNSGTLGTSLGNAIGDQSTLTVASGAVLALGSSETIGSLAGAGSVGSVVPATLTTGGNGTSTVFSGVMSDAAPGFPPLGTLDLVKEGSGTLSLSGTNTYTGGTTVNGGTLQLGNGGTTGSIVGGVTVNAGATFAVNRSDNLTLTNNVIGAGGFAQNGTGTTTFNQVFTYTGGTTVNNGVLQMAGVGTLGAITGTTRVNAGGTIDLGLTTQTQNGGVTIAGGTIRNGTLNSSGTFSGLGGTVSAVLGGTGNFVQTSGTTNLAGVNTYTGATTVNGGTLAVNGSIASSSGTTVNAGGTLGGTGTLGNVTINGGTLAPGNSIGTVTINGNLTLSTAATYLVEIDPNISDRTNVTGTATLGGARVSAIYTNGSYVTRSYTILNAQGGVVGTFNSLVNANLPANFTPTLRYDANNAYLDIALNFTPTPTPTPPLAAPAFLPLTTNQMNVATGLINSFNTAGGIPLVFGTLTRDGLTAVSGEHATGTQQTTFDAMDRFVNVLTDPFVGTRAGGGPQMDASGYADEDQRKRTGAERDAYAAFKAPTKAIAFERRWSVWGAGYGGTQQTDGDAGVGSQKLTNHVYGGAAGFDYRLTPETLLGFALGGAGTTFGLANGLGGGRSEVFQAGLYGRHTSGPAYISGALAWGWQDITTNRTVFANSYRANFDANAITGRLEGGWRFAYGTSGITPYAAGQVTSFFLPGYAEQLVAGVNTFALAYADKDVTASRTELGLRGDTSFTAVDAIVTLRGRAAWAHNFNADRSVSAVFQTIPVSGFTVFGASPAQNSALVSGGAEAKWLNGFSVAATFEGEFSSRTDSYAGKGIVRYQW